MQYARLGRAGAQVSRLALGTMNFGWKIDEQASHEILDRALELGINFIDTADVYGSTTGASEEVIGRWLSSGGSARRDSVVLASKVANPVGNYTNAGGLSAVHIRNAAEATLRRLGTDYLDLYQLHNVDQNVDGEEIWQALDQLVTSGKVIYAGTCNHGRADLAELAAARQGGGAARLGIVSEQSRYNAIDREVEAELLPYCRENGVAFLAYSPLKGGVLGGREGSQAGRRQGKSASRLREADGERLDRLEAICAEAGVPVGVGAIGWLLGREGLTSVLTGPGSVAQLEAVAEHADTPLPQDAAEQIDQLWAPVAAAA